MALTQEALSTEPWASSAEECARAVNEVLEARVEIDRLSR
jgi:hypothetical protein